MAVLRGDDGVGVLRETRDSPPLDYLFKIKSFSSFRQNGFEKIESNKFEAGGHQWKILFFPNGDDEVHGDYISMYLSVASKNSLADGKVVNVIFKFFLFDQIRGNYLTVQGIGRRFDRVRYRWGLSKFISLGDFMEPTSGFLVNDTCFLGVEVYVIRSSGHFQGSSGLRECVSITKTEDVSYKYTWKLTGFSELVDKCCSDEFVVGSYKWRLRVWPEGDSENRGCSLSLYLELLKSPGNSPAEKVKAQFTVTLQDQINMEHHRQEDTAWFRGWNEMGWGSFIQLKDLKDSTKGFLVDDCCIFEVEVSLLYATHQKSLNP